MAKKKIMVEGHTYISRHYLIGRLTRERLTVRKHLKDEKWREEWRDLKEYEKILTDILYTFRQI